MREQGTRFLLLDDSEKGIDPDWYHLFEPTVELEIKGKQVLGKHTKGGIRNVIIFVFMEHALNLTERMVTNLDSSEFKEFVYWFTGTGHGLQLSLREKTLDVDLLTDPMLGPVSNDALTSGSRRLGTVNPVEWVQAVAGLGQELAARFKSYHDSSAVLKSQERSIHRLQTWEMSSA